MANSRQIALANRYIGKSTNKRVVLYKNASVEDIIKAVVHADRLSGHFTARFAPMLRAGTHRQTLKNVWQFTRRNITYLRDTDGEEVVKSPGKTWEDRTADCKSLSVFIASILKNLGYEYFYRVVFYDPASPNQGHIYPIAVLPDGEEVPMDAVNTKFDEEYAYWKAEDYQHNGKRAGISGPPPTKRRGIIVAGMVGLAIIMIAK